MPIEQLVAAYLETTLLALVATGLLIRGRIGLCWSFFAYLLLMLTIHWLLMLCTEQFWTLSFYIGKETALFVVKVAIAVEIWQRTFWSFPRARIRVGLLLVAALLATAAAGVTVPSRLDLYDVFIGIVNPRRQAGALALYVIVVSTASWYRVPLHPLHRAILVGFAGCLIVHTLVGSFIGWHHGSTWALRLSLVLLVTAYSATLLWWARAAWRQSQAPGAIVARLQPWARSW